MKSDDAKYFEQDAVALLNVKTIDQKLLDAFLDSVNKAMDSHVNCTKQANRPEERDACDAQAAREICDILRRIKRFNKKALPAGATFEQYWEMYSCVDTPY